MKKKEDSSDWRELAEKSLTQQISVLRLWQGESRLLNNWKMAAMSLGGVVIGFAGNLIISCPCKTPETRMNAGDLG